MNRNSKKMKLVAPSTVGLNRANSESSNSNSSNSGNTSSNVASGISSGNFMTSSLHDDPNEDVSVQNTFFLCTIFILSFSKNKKSRGL